MDILTRRPNCVPLFVFFILRHVIQCMFQAEKMKKTLKSKLELAKFLQETIHETALQKKKSKSSFDKVSAAEEFSTFVDKVSTLANV